MTVVVCEDDKNLLQLIELIISELNVDVIKCNEAECLIETVNKDNVDLVIVDYWLKKTKADSVIKSIQISNPTLPIILMSAVQNLSEITEKLKVSDYIKKPFDIEEFKLKVTNYLR